MIVTKGWLRKNQVKAGGWTAQQLAILNVPKIIDGWSEKVIGSTITPSQRIRFEFIAAESHRKQTRDEWMKPIWDRPKQ